jgi:seryl-tRNA synthetase
MESGLDEVLELDRRRRELLPELEGLRAEQNAASKEIGAAKRHGEDPTAAISAMEEVAARGRALSDRLSRIEAELERSLALLPNLPDPDAAPQDAVVREVGEAGRRGRDHLELAAGMIDMEAAARTSGSRFAYLKGDLVLVEMALVRYALDRASERGFQPVIPPVLVREAAMFGTGFLPDTEQQVYRVADEDLYMVGTSEVPLASLHAGEVLDADRLPLRYGGFSTCFRREAGAAGKDTRGIFRVHQFDKVELFSFVSPPESPDEHERLLAIQEAILQELAIPYRVVNIGVADLGASAAKKYDCEAWLPGEGRYREVTSCSNTTDFQARRLDIRYRPRDGRPQPVHTLNGTAVAVGRTIIALLENGQREDGGVDLPAVLSDYGAPRTLAPRS